MKGFLTKKILLILPVFLVSSTIFGQDFLQIYNKTKDRFQNEPIKVNGFVSTDLSLYGSSDSTNRRSPFQYRINAALNFDILGIKVPLSVNYAGKQVAYNYSLPSYKFIGLSPTYKWATLHLGNRSMSFSQNTLSGRAFKGVGAEIAPGKFKLAAFYGTIEEPRVPQFENAPALPEPFKRIAYGAKFEFGDKRKWGFIFFNAQDDPFSVSNDTFALKPLAKGNTVFSIKNEGQIKKRITYSFELAHSLITEDKTNDVDLAQFSKRSSFFPTFNATTSGKNVVLGTVQYAINNGLSLKMEYNRVDKGYQSFGTQFITNDIENYVLGTNVALFKKKMTLTTNMGLQRDNVSEQGINSTTRFIGSASTNISFGQKFNSNLTYSNFNTVQVKDVTQETLDATAIYLGDIRYLAYITQVSQNASAALTYSFGDTIKVPLSVVFSFQNAKEIRNHELVQESETQFYSLGLNSGFPLGQSGVSISTGIMGAENHSVAGIFQSITPTVGCNASIFNNMLSINGSVSWSKAFLNGKSNKEAYVFQSGINVLKIKNQKIGARIRLVSQNSSTPQGQPNYFGESTVSLTYSYKIAPKIKLKKE